MAILRDLIKTLGGEGSGNFGHSGRPGQVGGSQARGGPMAEGRQKIAKLAKGVRFEIRGFAEKIGLDLDNPSNNANPKHQKYAEKYQKWRRSLEKVYLGDEVRKKSFDRMRVRGFNLRKEAARMAGEPKQAGTPESEAVHPNMDPAEFYKVRPDLLNPLVGFKEHARLVVNPGAHVDEVYKLTGVDGDGKPCVAFFKPDDHASSTHRDLGRSNVFNHKDDPKYPTGTARELAAYELGKIMGTDPNMAAAWKDSKGKVGCLVAGVLDKDTVYDNYFNVEGPGSYTGSLVPLADQAMMNIITGNTDGHVRNGRISNDHSKIRQIDFGCAFPVTTKGGGNRPLMANLLWRSLQTKNYEQRGDSPLYQARRAEVPAIRARMTEQAEKVKAVDWSRFEKYYRFTRGQTKGIMARADAILELKDAPVYDWEAYYRGTLSNLGMED